MPYNFALEQVFIFSSPFGLCSDVNYGSMTYTQGRNLGETAEDGPLKILGEGIESLISPKISDF